MIPLKDQDKFDPFSFLQKNAIQIWASVPSLISMNWARKPATIQDLPDLKQTLFTGEALSPNLLSLWSQLGKSEVENLYGPVEATVWATRHRCTSEDTKATAVPIGQALPSVSCLIQNEELILSGPQVAVGYLTEAGLKPFHGTYATGDWVEEKQSRLVFLGRHDHQVKIRGQRIELEAIESLVLTELNEVAVCLTDHDQIFAWLYHENSMSAICMIA